MSRPRSHHVPWSICPTCGATFDGAMNVEGRHRAPRNGDAALCWGCGGLAVYDDTLVEGQRIPTDAELAELLATPAIQVALAALREVIEGRAR